MNSKLKDIIEERGIKITWLSDRSGVSRNTIHTYINGGIPALDKAYAIAKALGLSVNDIWENKEETSE
jgi:lambda repressor-like predicted transcriptional regulator